MGSRLSSVRQDPAEPTQTNDVEYSHSTGPRIRTLSQTPTATGLGVLPSRSISRHVAGEHFNSTDPSAMALSRLISELESSGISSEDAHLLRFIRSYRSSSHSTNQENDASANRTSRSQSISENWLLNEGLSHGGLPSSSSRSHTHRGTHSRSHRSGHRNRTTSLETAGVDENGTDTSAGPSTEGRPSLRLTSAGRQALFSLAAASARQRPWTNGLFLLDGRDRPCAICKRMVPHDEYDLHYVMCLTRPRVTYNEDKLSVEKGECSICLEDLTPGQAIARLPCLCIYHKQCIDEWFKRKQTCPEHPDD